MGKLKIHHISLNVKDIKESEIFYQVLGFNRCYSYQDMEVEIIHLKNGKFILELFDHKQIKHDLISNMSKMSYIGLHHFSLVSDDIELDLKKLNEFVKGKKKIHKGRTGINYFFITDPDGNMIEIVEDKRKLI